MVNKQPTLEELISLAWEALGYGQLKVAMQHAQQANKLAPSSPEVAHILGILASRDGKPDIALPLLQKAIDAGPTAQKLRHITEALLVAGHAKAALAPISDAVKNYPPESDTFGLLAAVQVALEQWDYAIKSAQAACQLNPNTAIWQSTLSFCQLMQQNWVDGFESFTARAENLGLEARSPALHMSSPCDLWIKNEQGPGDTLFFARYAPHLAKQGYRLHIQTDPKTLPLLQETKVFASVFEKMKHKRNAHWISAGDLPLAAIQTASEPIAPALPLTVDAQRTKKIQAELAKLGPAPYIAITWRGGPKGRKQRAGVRMYEKFIDPTVLGKLLKGTQGTLISIQRLPETDEFVALCKAAGKQVVDWSSLNNNLPGMLSFLSIADEYIAVPNTNVHLRESVGKPSHVFLNRPFQDWRWLAEGNISPWYPNATIYRQSQSGDWNEAIEHAQKSIAQLLINSDETPSKQAIVIDESDIKENLWQRTIADGWVAIDNEDIPLAIQKAQEVLSQAPNNARALHLLGWAAVTDMKFEIALQLLKKSADLSPQDGIIWRDLVRGLTLNGLYQEAIDTATFCLTNPDMRSKSALHYALAAVYYKLGNETKALEHYDECLKISPNNLDAIAFSGMIRMKMGSGHARIGFKQYSARKESRREDMRDFWICPTLKGDISGLKILLIRDMGLGDELTYLRYLPWLVNSGAQVDYWCGAKLEPLLNRSNLGIKAISDRQPIPQPSQYDLAFIVTDLPAAVEYLGAPEIAPPLPIHVRADLIEKWKVWLAKQGPAPYIGLNWRAGVASQDNAVSFTKLAKAIEPEKLASTLSNVEATWISLQRNVTKMDLNSFEQILGAPLHDAAGLTDDIEDLLALLSLLDANVGVSNTNMHLRAGLGLGSHVLVQNPGGDWRWGIEGNESVWFKDCKVYRQNIQADWSDALKSLQQDLQTLYGERSESSLSSLKQIRIKETDSINTSRLIWLTAGIINTINGEKVSDLASARYRVITPSEGLAALGWQSEIINEGTSLTMGGWGSSTPQEGDTLIVSKVFTEHAVRLAKDAQNRGATVVLDLCDNFLAHPKRGPLQKALLAIADKVVTSTQALNEALATVGKKADAVISDPVEFKRGEIKFAPGKVLKLMWFGHAVNIDTLAQSLPALAQLASTTPLQLNVVTTLPNGQQDLNKITPQGLNASYTAWSISATEAAIAECDIVIIPTLQSDIKNAKSPNRLLEPLWAGRMVVAGRLPAYMHFADSAWVGKNLTEGIQWCLANPSEVKARIAQGQADVEKYFTEQAIAKQWHILLTSEASTNQQSEVVTQVKSAATVQKLSPTSNHLKELALLTTQHPSLPSIAIRLIEPLGALDEYSVKIASGFNSQKQLSIDYQALLMRDVIIVQRDFPSADTLPLLKKLKALGKKLVYETDDAFHLIPEDHPKAYHHAKAPAIFEFASMADLITVSTQALAQAFSPYGRVAVVPNRLSPNLWHEALLKRHQQARAAYPSNLIRVGVVGGADHAQDLAIISEAISAIAEKQANIVWVAYGDGALAMLKQTLQQTNIEAQPSNFDYTQHPQRLADLALDIALVPLLDNTFNQCRSNLKFLEYGFLAVPAIYSNVESYNTTVIDGETGLLASNTTESWVKAIITLIEQADLRSKLGKAAKQTVEQHWMLSKQHQGWSNILDNLK